MPSALGLVLPPTLTGFGEPHTTFRPQFSHLYVGVITAPSLESRDEQENEGLAPCPATVVSVAVVN